MSDFRDPELERLLGGTGGPAPDVNVAYERVKGRVRQAKRRRAAVVGGAACTLLLAMGVLVAGRNDRAGSIQPGGEITAPDDSRLQPDDTTDDSTPDSTDATTESTTDEVPGPSTTPSPSAPAGTTPNNSTAPGTTVANVGSTPTQSTVASTPTTATVPVASTPVTTAPTSSDPASTAPPATSAPVTQSFDGVGGSVTVRLQDGTLTLLGYQAADGFGAEVKQSSGDRVEVRFESANHRTDARVDLSNGSMVQNFDESER